MGQETGGKSARAVVEVLAEMICIHVCAFATEGFRICGMVYMHHVGYNTTRPVFRLTNLFRLGYQQVCSLP